MLTALQSKSKASQAWEKHDANDLYDIIMRKEVCDKMTTHDKRICSESSCMQDDSHKISFCKSCKKANLANALQDGVLTQCVTEKLCLRRRKA